MFVQRSSVLACAVFLTGCLANPPQHDGPWLEKQVSGDHLTYIYEKSSSVANDAYQDALSHCTLMDKKPGYRGQFTDDLGNQVSKYQCN